jgi:hypothetical protein
VDRGASASISRTDVLPGCSFVQRGERDGVAATAHLLVLGRDICAGIISARAACAYERLRAPAG